MTAYYPSSYSGIPDTASEQSQNHINPISSDDVPTAVHKLLASTKRLQEVLELWSVEQTTEAAVSDLYVQIGHEFNATIGAFAKYNIDLSDIHSIPAELRTVLEHCLAEDPSPDVLATFKPDLRRVLFKLLKGLQSRQEKWRAVTIAGGLRAHTPPETH